ncbi:sigma factor G inhibitor Gin [Salibacterium aidingense]|uniref:sigma factor G inhibitor Gin n=1 Tax=Salibacterium aidingense TaxID=384933 RepID=UPI000403B357|nr:sigma factor G inhibitor Gin [Salibacterium aidingense]
MTEKKEGAESCILCERYENAGIHIMDSFICRNCEKELILLDTGDPKYNEAIKKLRKLKASKLLM